jgi:hypothetical protein
MSNHVADWLGIRMTHEHLLSRRREGAAVRPDGVYRAGDLPDFRPEVWVEVDLGHYSRRRIQEKVDAAVRLQEHTVRGMVFVCATRSALGSSRAGSPRRSTRRCEWSSRS